MAQRIEGSATTTTTTARALSWRCAVLVLATLPGIGSGQGAPTDGQVRLAPVVVTATRTETPAFDVPASIDRIGADAIRDGRPQINISESLGGVAGLLARDRQNYAQDVQISVRGFGARSTFGIRGVRLYVDGIPATLPDGQGQISNVDLGSAESIEVLRGPFSALYGNSSGGVIQVFTEEGSGAPTFGASVAAGSYGALRFGLKASGGVEGFGYVVSGSTFRTDGYRDHSAAERNIGNAKITWHDDANRWTLIANSVALPKAQDPLGLTRAQFDTDPRGVDPAATTFDTRKTVDQTQVGVIYERRVDAVNSWRALFYSGHRNTEQFQAIPVAAQASPLHPGGVIALGRDYRGTDLRWTAKTRLADAPLTIVAGIAYDALDEHRFGYQNFIGTTLGVQGALRRDEDNTVANFDQYAQGSWQFAERWTLHAGVRHSSVRFSSEDHYIVGPNPDDSGRLRFAATLPVAGLMFAATPALHVYVTAGRGFETPTLNELAYRPNGQTGLNLALGAARNDSYEAGVKTRTDWGDVNVALFETRTDNEIATLSNVGGRSTFQNVGATRRRGLEAAWSRDLRENLRAQLAYTWLDARYLDTFTTCTATPCAVPNLTIPAGNRIPGIARDSLYGALAWAPPLGWRGGVEARALGRVWVNDANADAASGFAVVNANVGYAARVGSVDVTGFARVDNVLARRYAGSVIVNEGNSRFFEPAPGRNWTVGLAATVGF
ncbi:MAG TPA: TonB-dependent receptor [Caldimonas sp.]|jgi:iron complex outermembrane receptor protein|nr:TonB-dependent receptor [Caldimonas sp.]